MAVFNNVDDTHSSSNDNDASPRGRDYTDYSDKHYHNNSSRYPACLFPGARLLAEILCLGRLSRWASPNKPKSLGCGVFSQGSKRTGQAGAQFNDGRPYAERLKKVKGSAQVKASKASGFVEPWIPRRLRSPQRHVQVRTSGREAPGQAVTRDLSCFLVFFQVWSLQLSCLALLEPVFSSILFFFSSF